MGATFQPGDTVRRVHVVGPRDSGNGMFLGRLYQVAFQDGFLHLEGTVGKYIPAAFELVGRPEPKPKPIKVGDWVRILEIPGVTYGVEPGDGKGARANGQHEDQGKVVQVSRLSREHPGTVRAGSWSFNPEDLEKVNRPDRQVRDASLDGILKDYRVGRTDITLTRDLITQLFERD